MQNWGVNKNEQQEVLQRLIKERFIDDRRYAEAFIREKCNLSAWGRYKIQSALKRKGIASDIIAEALAELNPTDNKKRLQDRLQTKIKHIKYDTAYQLKTKLIRYALSLGFEMDEVMDSVNDIIKNNNITECDD
jgi:regulatory protein